MRKKYIFLKLLGSQVLAHPYLRRCCLTLLNKVPNLKMKLRRLLLEGELSNERAEDIKNNQYSSRVLKIYETLIVAHDKKNK